MARLGVRCGGEGAGLEPLELEPRGQAGAASGLAQAQAQAQTSHLAPSLPGCTWSPPSAPKHLPQLPSHLQGRSSWWPCLSQSWGAAVPRPCPRAGSMPSRCVHQAWREQRQWALSAAVPQGGASCSRPRGWRPVRPAGSSCHRVPCHRHLLPAAFVHCRRLTYWAPSPPASPASYSLAVLCPGQRVLPGLYRGVPVQDWVARGPRGGVSWDAAPGLEGSLISGQGILVHLGDTQCPDT